MPIPDYQILMRPTLQAVSDGREYTSTEVFARVAEAMGITAEELSELLPSGKQTVFVNRVGWAITYMGKAGLLARPRRGVVSITERGRAALSEHPDRIDNKVLETFPEFVEFRSIRHERAGRAGQTAPPVATGGGDGVNGSPDEAIQALVDDVNATVASEVLERVLAKPPVFLEHLVLRLLGEMGYGGVEATTEHLGGPNDEGLDGLIRQDALGLDVVYVQAKRYAPDRTIGRPDLQAFVGALNGARAERGIFITTSSFTAGAREFVSRIQQRLVLIDGVTLARRWCDATSE